MLRETFNIAKKNNNLLQKILSLNKDYKQLFKNFLSLSSLQGLYYILPLITLPYLVRVLGTENFGIWVYATNLISYFQTITEYGFHLSGTKSIALHRDNKDKISEIFSSILQIKVYFLIILFIVLIGIVLTFDRLSANKEIYLLTYGMVIGQALFPLWLFQGLEKMSYITHLNFVTKFLGTISIFIFVHNASDLLYVPLIYSSSSILLGILALIISFLKLKVKFNLQSLSNLKYHLIEGWPIFISSLSVNTYIKSNIIILGMFTNNLVVGQYAIAEKLIFALRGGALVLFQTIYPYVCRIAATNSDDLRLFFKKLFIPLSILFLFIGSFIFLSADHIVYLIAGEYILEAVITLKILSLFPLLEILIVPFYQTLLALNKKKSYSMVMLFGAILNIILNIILANLYSYIGTSITVILTDQFILFFLYIHSNRALTQLKKS